eukprot:g19778.t1
MGDRHQTTIKVISGHHAAEVISNPKELDVSIGVQQEQLQMWLLQEARFAALLVGAPATTYLCGWVPKLAI